jgi:hypothetical protein
MRRHLGKAAPIFMALYARAAYGLSKPAPGAAPETPTAKTPSNMLIWIGGIVVIGIALAVWRKKPGGKG